MPPSYNRGFTGVYFMRFLERPFRSLLCQAHERRVCHPDDAASRNRSRPVEKETADDGSAFREAIHFGWE